MKPYQPRLAIVLSALAGCWFSLSALAITPVVDKASQPAPAAKSQPAQAKVDQRQEQQRQHQQKQALLKRIYEARMRLDRERANNDMAARNNVQLIRQNTNLTADAPTVRQMRQETAAQLARFEQSLRCLDVDVESNGGNTVVICGGNSGDITGENVSAGRDIIAPVPVPMPIPVPGSGP